MRLLTRLPILLLFAPMHRACDLGAVAGRRVWISSLNAAKVAQKGFDLVHAASDYFYLVRARPALPQTPALSLTTDIIRIPTYVSNRTVAAADGSARTPKGEYTPPPFPQPAERTTESTADAAHLHAPQQQLVRPLQDLAKGAHPFSHPPPTFHLLTLALTRTDHRPTPSTRSRT